MRYPGLKIFRNVEREMTAEFLQEKSMTCTTNTLQAQVAALRKLQEGLHAMNWIREDIVPEDWKVQGAERPRGAYAPPEAAAIMHWLALRSLEYGQALRFILSSGARIDEVFHLRADKIDVVDKRVQLLGKGGQLRRIPVLHADVLQELDLSRRFVYLKEEQGDRWKDGLERYVRQACDVLGIQRHGVHGFRATAACEFMTVKRALGYTERGARKELATLAPHTSACGAMQVCGGDTIQI
jgi:integrase